MTDLQAIEDAIRAHPDPVVTVNDVVDAIEDDVSDTHVRQQMRLLERADAVESKQVGARAVAWWHVERVCPPVVAPEDHPDQSVLSDAERERAESEATGGDSEADELMDPDAAAIEDVDTPSLSTREEFETAAFAIYNYLRDHGNVGRGEFIDALADEFPAGYDNEDTWWRRVGRPALRAHPETVNPAGGNPWRFRE